MAEHARGPRKPRRPTGLPSAWVDPDLPGRLLEARRLVESEDPETQLKLQRLGQAIRAGDAEDVLRCTNELIEHGTQSNEDLVWNARAEALLALRRYPQAAEAYSRAIKAGADNEQTWLRLGNCLSLIKAWFSAVQAYDQAIRHDPGNPEIWFNRGVALLGRDKFELALASFQEALAVSDERIGHYGKAWAYYLMGEHETDWRKTEALRTLGLAELRESCAVGELGDESAGASMPLWSAWTNPAFAAARGTDSQAHPRDHEWAEAVRWPCDEQGEFLPLGEVMPHYPQWDS